MFRSAFKKFIPRAARAFSSKASQSSRFQVDGISLVAAGCSVVVGFAAMTMESSKASAAPVPEVNYNQVYRDIASLLSANNYDDGSMGPVLVRLAWHAAGTYDKHTNTGGSNGSTMRFLPESGHGANAGLSVARDLLERVKAKHPAISYADLWSLAGVVAIQELGGPIIPWRAGRKDYSDGSSSIDGRLPDAGKDADHLRFIFYRMGFSDGEIVALSGAHALGRCHPDRSGFTGPWTFSPTVLDNSYFSLLLSEKWTQKKWSGPRQFEDAKTKTLMMLPTDLALIQDKSFKPYVELYASSNDKFNEDFAAAFKKLLELGVYFAPDAKTYTFRPL